MPAANALYSHEEQESCWEDKQSAQANFLFHQGTDPDNTKSLYFNFQSNILSRLPVKNVCSTAVNLGEKCCRQEVHCSHENVYYVIQKYGIKLKERHKYCKASNSTSGYILIFRELFKREIFFSSPFKYIPFKGTSGLTLLLFNAELSKCQQVWKTIQTLAPGGLMEGSNSCYDPKWKYTLLNSLTSIGLGRIQLYLGLFCHTL